MAKKKTVKKAAVKKEVSNDRMLDLKHENAELRDLIRWMRGCGYNFNQHAYWKEQREKLSLG